MHKEIFVGHLPVIKHAFYNVDGAPRTVTNPKAVVGINTYTASQADTGKLEVILPYEDYAHLEQSIEVEWQYTFQGTDIKRKEVVDIVTPLAEWDEFAETFEDNDLTYRDFRKVEQLVRQIINAYCGQTFGKFVGALPAEGNGLDGLILSQHIISVTGVSWFEADQNVINIHDPNQYVPDHQFGNFDYDGPHTIYGWEIAAEGWLIRRQGSYRDQDPTTYARGKFQRNKKYFVTGVYGWDGVPAPVQKAAALLIEDYICPDAEYRNKYLDSIKFDNHRLDYHQKAWAGTGNVMADQLLREYRLTPTIGVI